jgi:hypothetical protein
MQTRLRTATGLVTLVWGGTSAAQGTAPTAAVCASCPPPPGMPLYTRIPDDPTWFIAGLITGLAIGYVAGKVFSTKTDNAQRTPR